MFRLRSLVRNEIIALSRMAAVDAYVVLCMCCRNCCFGSLRLSLWAIKADRLMYRACQGRRKTVRVRQAGSKKHKVVDSSSAFRRHAPETATSKTRRDSVSVCSGFRPGTSGEKGGARLRGVTFGARHSALVDSFAAALTTVPVDKLSAFETNTG